MWTYLLNRLAPRALRFLASRAIFVLLRSCPAIRRSSTRTGRHQRGDRAGRRTGLDGHPRPVLVCWTRRPRRLRALFANNYASHPAQARLPHVELAFGRCCA